MIPMETASSFGTPGKGQCQRDEDSKLPAASRKSIGLERTGESVMAPIPMNIKEGRLIRYTML